MAAVSEQTLHEILRYGVSAGASDVHLKVSEPPLYRIDGAMTVQPDAVPLGPAETMQYGAILLARAGYNFKVDQVREFDFAHSAPQLGRFRVNLFRSRGSFAIVLRIIPHKVPTLDQLALVPVLKDLALVNRGMILVTGNTGSGKSTTLAAMIDRINDSRRCHILTIEDPIEYLHQNKLACISQREVGTDTQSFLTAFRGALRQDPDVILVGEMRDMESMEMALRAAETGHLVLSTLHTTDTSKSINRMLAFFPAEQQQEVRLRLGDGLAAIVCQRLVQRSDRAGRVAASEILVATDAICDCIRDPRKTGNIVQLQETGESYGMQTFDQHVIRMYTEGIIDLATARDASTSASNFDRLIAIMRAESDVESDKLKAAAKLKPKPTNQPDQARDNIPGFERTTPGNDDYGGSGR